MKTRRPEKATGDRRLPTRSVAAAGIKELLQVIDAWAEAKRLEAFFADAEHRAQDLPDEERERTIERLRRARVLVGSTDALERFDAWRAPEER